MTVGLTKDDTEVATVTTRMSLEKVDLFMTHREVFKEKKKKKYRHAK